MRPFSTKPNEKRAFQNLNGIFFNSNSDVPKMDDFKERILSLSFKRSGFYLLAISFILLGTQYSCKINHHSFSAGFLVHTLQDERWAIERDAITAKVTELGGAVLFENAEEDERKQYHLAKQMIEGGIDVLILVPVNSKTAASIARLCSENGVKLIAYDIIVENCDLDLYITFNNEKVGQLMAEYAIKHQPSGNYVLLWGDSNMKVAQWIKDGQLKVLKPYIESGQIQVTYRAFVEDWSQSNSKFIMDNILNFSNEKVDVVLASSDGIAQGVIDACVAANQSTMPLITGQDASQSALNNVRQGMQAMTIRKSFTDLAERAAVCAYELAQGKKVTPDTLLNNGRFDIPSILLPPSVIDQSNLGN